MLACLQEEIIHEAQTMKSYNHKSVLPLYTSFVHGQDLWMVTPFMSGGSVLHIMKYQHPEVSAACSGCNSSRCSG
jgi:serine/threonine-protein kinase OSR1/STK39